MQEKKRILVLGKRGGILQWYENLLAIQNQEASYQIEGFALNHNNIKERFLKKFLPNKDVYTANLLQKKIRKFQPDLILIADLFYFNDHLLKVLSDHPSKKAHWIGDFFDSRLTNSKDIINLYCFTDSSFIEDAQKLGLENTTYLPLAYNPDIFFESTLPKNDRLLFVGAWSPDRQELLEKIPLPMSIYGKGWDKLHKPNSSIHPHNIDLSEVADLYRQHKYVLNVINKKNIRQGMNMRCFEAPACGCILVSEYVKDLEFVFDVEQEIVCFSDPSELQFKLKHTIIDPALAMSKVQQSHTYKNRLEAIIDFLL
ncbi:CgeB family protein [Acinetobacter sp. ANC 4641]|uniref:CgeB family protein n=1 Tax=Acinetobacter sp. ANC 4641 TaxID=2529847 RepID=UPI001039BBDD|nr:glycosyltransferase [Acinetobacter sp. ANC 4641]TCB11878.1 glycosyltransferase family 1 protein [Acinetobacter sp. ANC 4641]